MRFRTLMTILCLVVPATATSAADKLNQITSAIVESPSVEVIDPIEEAPNSAEKEMLCLALNMYHEARGSTLNDQKGVGLVTLNRRDASEWSNTICGVVAERSQFSWTTRSVNALVPRERTAWIRMQELAYELYQGNIQDITGGATHFYNPRAANPSWARHGSGVKKLGAHVYMQL